MNTEKTLNSDAVTVAIRVLLVVVAVAATAVAARQATVCCSSISAPRALAMLGAGAGFSIIFLALALRAGSALLKRVFGEMVLLGLVVATAEIAVTASRPEAQSENHAAREIFVQRRAANKLQAPMDTRLPSEVVLALRDQGIDALPGIDRGWPLNETVRKHLAPGFFPLSHASNATVVECNEDGKYLVFRTDEFGFNNPPGLVASKQIDVAVVGESFALGHCVDPGQSFVDLLRDAHPRTANFGLAGTRSLSALATFREYVEPLQPAVVLWVVNLGYLEAAQEASSETLMHYLHPSFSQGLIDKQSEVDALVREFVLPLRETMDSRTALEIERLHTPARFDSVYALPNVRTNLDILRSLETGSGKEPDFAEFKESLRLAHEAVDRWGGVLMIVVAPSYAAPGGAGSPEDVRNHGVLIETAAELGVHVVDGGPAFKAAADPQGLFALRKNNHPNARGHSLMASLIIEELRQNQGLRSAERHWR